jgi:Holliday junction DNA helicase RuvB
MQQGLIARTPRGRVLAEGGWRHLGRVPPRGAPSQLDLLADEGDGR